VSLRGAQNYVRAFHRKFEQGNPDEPTLPGQGTILNRIRWIDSELAEIEAALDMTDEREALAGLADGYIDVIVFALGGLVECGVDGTPLFDEVMRANMTKVKVPGVAKIQKPATFVHPDIATLIDTQRSRK
jgi:predicted HAD superfamily Cof-like phosphohydrolase